MTIRSTLLSFGTILWLAAAGCWWRARGSWRLSREGWLFLILGVPFFVAGWFFTASSYPEERAAPTPAPLAVLVPPPAPQPPPATSPAAREEPATYAEAVNAAQHAAVARYPDLGRRGTEFNARFIAAYRQLKLDDPAFFSDPEWPLHLADRIAQTPLVPP